MRWFTDFSVVMSVGSGQVCGRDMKAIGQRKIRSPELLSGHVQEFVQVVVGFRCPEEFLVKASASRVP